MTSMTTFARAILPAAILAAAPAAAADSPDLARLKAHLTAVQTMTANFTQTDAKGRTDAGTLQLKRPGRVRFEYSGGDLLLVADGKKLSFLDYQVGQKSSWPLGKTPLGPLLSSSPDFNGRLPRRTRLRDLATAAEIPLTEDPVSISAVASTPVRSVTG